MPTEPTDPDMLPCRRRRLRAATGLALAALLGLGTASAEPMVGASAQVGAPAGGDKQYVFLLMRFLDGAAPAPAYAVYRKAGAADSPNPYARIAVIQKTSEPLTVAALLNRADAAGFDNAELAATLDDLLPAIPGDLPEKLAALIAGELPDGFDEAIMTSIVGTHPQAALPLGQAHVAAVPAGELSTFEIREFEVATMQDGVVAARVTAGTSPQVLPAPDGLSERVETTARGHLRVLLRWCVPEALGEMGLHWSGFTLYRIDNAAFEAAFGAPPALDLDRPSLLALEASGHAVQVNRHPITPGDQLPCPPAPGDPVFFFADDKDTKDQPAFEIGGDKFENGEHFTYFAAVRDHFGRIGDPSPGLSVQICDRLSPPPPAGVTVTNEYSFAGGAPDHRLAVNWKPAPASDVQRYHVLRYPFHDSVFQDRVTNADWPDSPNRIAVIDNAGGDDLIHVIDDGPGAPSLPAFDGKTVWYCVVAEDDSACPDAAGFGNLSGPSGVVPGSLHLMAGPDAPQGRITFPCCTIDGSGPALGANQLRQGMPVTVTRDSPRIIWAEFREAISGTFMGHFAFGGGGGDTLGATLDTTGLNAAQFQARFGTVFGAVSEWIGAATTTGPAFPGHHWDAEWTCLPNAGACPDGVIDPVNTQDGSLADFCLELTPTAGAVEFAVFRMLDRGSLVMIEREKFPVDEDGDPVSAIICEARSPAHAARMCFYAQYFDRNGSPSVVRRIACVTTPGVEGLPTPAMTRFAPFDFFLPEGATSDCALGWFCPTPGVERFEIALTPPPDGAASVIVENNAEWGIFDSPRIAAGFGNGSPEFAFLVALKRGTPYTAKVRAVLTDDNGGRVAGAWSDPRSLQWVADPDGGGGPGPCPVAWPARAVPGISESQTLHAELRNWVDEDGAGPQPAEEIWLEVGTFPPGAVTQPSQPGSQGFNNPPRIDGDSLDPFLATPLPISIYLHQTTAGSRGTMLQVSHFIDEILTQQPEPGVTAIIDKSFAVARRTGDADGPYRLWFRIRQPVMQGRAYRAAAVRHGMDAEPIEVIRSAEVIIPEP